VLKAKKLNIDDDVTREVEVIAVIQARTVSNRRPLVCKAAVLDTH
jgi:hypothetical protein